MYDTVRKQSFENEFCGKIRFQNLELMNTKEMLRSIFWPTKARI